MRRRQWFFVGEIVRVTDRVNPYVFGVITRFKKGCYDIEWKYNDGSGMSTGSRQTGLRRMLPTFGGPAEIDRR
jgi:hypothetical protein